MIVGCILVIAGAAGVGWTNYRFGQWRWLGPKPPLPLVLATLFCWAVVLGGLYLLVDASGACV